MWLITLRSHIRTLRHVYILIFFSAGRTRIIICIQLSVIKNTKEMNIIENVQLLF
jgi:hypothetical protein